MAGPANVAVGEESAFGEGASELQPASEIAQATPASPAARREVRRVTHPILTGPSKPFEREGGSGAG